MPLRRFIPCATVLFIGLVPVGLPAQQQKPPLSAQIRNPQSAIPNPDDGVVHSRRLAGGLPLGGIGCGTFELMTDGSISHAAINNNPDQPTGDLNGCFAAVWTNAGGRISARALRLKSAYGLPSVSAIDFRGLFPQAYVDYPDPAIPITISLRAYSSLIPHDIKNSSIPAALFVFTVKNDSRAPVQASIALSWENILGVGGTSAGGRFADRNGNAVVPLSGLTGYFGLRFRSPGRTTLAPSDRLRFNASGDYALVAEPPTRETEVTTARWNSLDPTPAWWSQFASEGTVEGKVGVGVEGSIHPAGVVAMKLALKEGETRELPFVFAWYTPLQYTSSGTEYGHLFEKSFDDAVEVARYALENRLTVAALVEDWQNRLLRSTLPPWLARKLINDAFPLFTNTVLTRDSGLSKTKPGPSLFAMLESPVDGHGALGAMDHRVIADYLLTEWFPDLELQALRQYAAAQAPSGAIPRLDGNLDVAIGPRVDGESPRGSQRLDVACSYVAEIARYYRWTGDQRFLDELYPSAKHAIQFAATLDKNEDGIPDGPSVYNVESGPACYNATMWLGALRISIDLANAMQDRSFTAQCREWLDRARKSVMTELWNGRFLRAIGKETARQGDKETDAASDLCCASQLAGQWIADTVGAGDILPAEALSGAIESLIALNDRAAPSASPLFVTGAGRLIEDRSAWPTHMEAYQAALYAFRGHPTEGLDLMSEVFHGTLGLRTPPWQTPLIIAADSEEPKSGTEHMTAMASWYFLNALEGVQVDLPGGRLRLTPNLPPSIRALAAPVMTPTFSAWLDYRPGPLRSSLVFRLDQMTPVTPAGSSGPALQTSAGLALKLIELPTGGMNAGEITASVGRAPVAGKVTRIGGGHLLFTFDTPLTLTTGQRLEFTIR